MCSPELSEALLGALGMRQIAVTAPTDDLDAYESFLLGRNQFYDRTVESLENAIATFRSVVERDPEFAEAWSYLAESLSISRNYTAFSDDEFDRRTSDAAESAAGRCRAGPDSGRRSKTAKPGANRSGSTFAAP